MSSLKKIPLLLKKRPLSLKKTEVLPAPIVKATEERKEPVSHEHAVVKGLYYYPNFLSLDEGKAVMKELDSNSQWVGVTSNPKSRRVIHYGYIYPYTGGPLQKTDPIPQSYSPMMAKLRETLITPLQNSVQDGSIGLPSPMLFDQLIINEYLTGQGIAAHTDHTSKFGPIVACITLGSGVEIEFTKGGGAKQVDTQSVYVEPNSLYVMSGDSRYIWKHAIHKRKSDMVNGKSIPRGKRVSLTFRKAIV